MEKIVEQPRQFDPGDMTVEAQTRRFNFLLSEIKRLKSTGKPGIVTQYPNFAFSVDSPNPTDQYRIAEEITNPKLTDGMFRQLFLSAGLHFLFVPGTHHLRGTGVEQYKTGQSIEVYAWRSPKEKSAYLGQIFERRGTLTSFIEHLIIVPEGKELQDFMRGRIPATIQG